jgi:anaerobic ribonucleoside-triphosphate reductase activating protein
MTAIAISRVHFPVTTLGPGRRLGIWFQGCSIRCAGCISADTWGVDIGLTSVEEVVTSVEPWLGEVEGITISGGEPFDQPAALTALLRTLRARTDVDVLVYSGHPYESLEPALQGMTGLIDALITDPYEQHAPRTLALRGSDNQRLHCLTERGAVRFSPYERAVSAEDRRFDVMFDEQGTVWLAGIPARNDIRRLEQALAAAGHHAVFSQAMQEDRP